MSTGSSNRNIVYRCTWCNEVKPRAELLAQRTVWTTIKPVKTVRSRTVGWACTACLEHDLLYNSPPLVASPGMADTRIGVPHG